MAPHDGDEDPAVYRSGSSKKKHDSEEAHTHNGKNGDSSHRKESVSNSGSKNTDVDEEMATFAASGSDSNDAEASDSENEEDEDDDDGTLLTVQPGFNRLMLALRDEGVMHFVKYVSAAAPGSVWDICGEFEVYMAEEADSDGKEGEV